MFLPAPSGPLSAAVVDALRGGDLGLLPDPRVLSRWFEGLDAIADDDLQLALWICFELHYRGFDEVPDSLEWEPAVISFRRALEDALLATLRREAPVPAGDGPVAARLRQLVDADTGPQLSRFMQLRADRSQYVEFVAHRSIYQLKEADPHTWAIPRLAGRAKAALVEIQFDEYGAGNTERMHSELYRKLMRGFGLDDTYGAYVDVAPGVGLAITNVISLFGLRRELRGALVGHLAAYEMTSSDPNRRYAKGLRRLGVDDSLCEFYDVHVTADALHEQLAAHDLCGGLADAEPGLADDILFGAAACLHVDSRFAEHVLTCWAGQQTSLRSSSGEIAALVAAVAQRLDG